MAKKDTKKSVDKTKKDRTNESNIDIINAICAEVADAEILDKNTIAELGFVSTGNFALDFICSGRFFGGGLPLGRVTEIYGPSSSGKTVIGTHVLQGVQKAGGIAVLIDSEHAYSEAFGAILGINTSELIYAQPETLEDCFGMIVKFVTRIRERTTDNRPIFIVYDSIASSPAENEHKSIIEEGEPIKHEMGMRARICSQYTRNIASLLSKQRAGVIVINQLRSKIGVLFGSPETTAGGGNSLEYYCSVRLDCRARKQILDDKKRTLGIMMDVKNTKNKVSKPFRVAEHIELFFDYGISPTSGLLKLLEQEGLIEKSGSWYVVPGTDFKFQGQKGLDEILLKYPQIVGAESPEQIKEFLNRNNQSLRISASMPEDSLDDAEEDE